MKAWILGATGPELTELPQPQLRDNEVLTQVHCCALNRADLGMLSGHLHGNAGGRGAVLGLEWSGEVVDTGSAVSGIQRGDRVMCSGAGGFAEYAKCDYGRLLPIPGTSTRPASLEGNPGTTAPMPFDEAATLPVALQTMHDALVTHGGLRPGHRVLIQGASSGVGLMGMLIARELSAALVIGTSTHDVRRRQLTDHGAHLALDTRDPGWIQAVLDETDGAGVDVLIDQVSGALANGNMQATRITGTIVNVGRLGGTRDSFNFDLHALRRINYIGVTFRTRSAAEVRDITARMRADLWPALQAGRLRVPISARFDFGRLPEALAHMAANEHFGKIVVTL